MHRIGLLEETLEVHREEPEQVLLEVNQEEGAEEEQLPECPNHVPSTFEKGKPRSIESSSLVLVINDTKLLMSCVKCFELGISNTCDEGVCGKEWWPQDHKEMVHGHEMMIMVEIHII
jgi:hypothetical protein